MSQVRGLTITGLLVIATAMAGCGDNQVRRSLGLLHQGPDPFAALPTRPIEIPETNELPIPDPSAPSPIAPDPIRTAHEVLDTEPPGTGDPTSTEQRLLAMLGAEDADPGIRALIDSEFDSNDDGTLFGRTPLVHRLFGIEARRLRREHAIDPEEELQRLREEGIIASPAPLAEEAPEASE